MRAIVQTAPETVTVEERDRPTPGPAECLVRVHSAGLCGSDAHAYRYDDGYKWIQMPRIMGHEYAGEVVEVGDGVDAFAPGDVVVEEPIHDCGQCFQCRNGQPNVCQDFTVTGLHGDGAYAEYTTVEARHLHAVPDGVDVADAAVTEPTSIAARAVHVRSELRPGENALVEGPGPIGVLTALAADALGADVLVSGLGKDADRRLPLLEGLGVETVEVGGADLGERTEAFTDGRGFDVVFDTTGHHTGVEMGADHVRRGGQLVAVGLPADPSEVSVTQLVRGEVSLDTSYGSTWSDFERALRLLESGDVVAGDVVDDYAVEDAGAAFEDFLDARVCKPVFRFGG